METPESSPVPPPPPPLPPAPGGLSEQQWIVFLHLSALAEFVLPTVGHILGPLVIWLVKKPDSPAIDAAGRNVLNFQISWTIWMVVAVTFGFSASCLVIPMILPVALGVAWFVFLIVGTIKASHGETYQFPLTIKML